MGNILPGMKTGFSIAFGLSVTCNKNIPAQQGIAYRKREIMCSPRVVPVLGNIVWLDDQPQLMASIAEAPE